MKKFIFGCSIALTGLTMPLAADYCCPTYPCEPEPCCGDFNGFYFGGNLGVYSNTAHRNDFDGFFVTGGTRSINSTNFTAGLQLGYDWQCSNTLFGIVADWNWVNNQHCDAAASVDEWSRNRYDWYTTIRGRVGVTVCDALVYVTLGGAVIGHDHHCGSVFGDWRRHFSRWGWAGGVGTEFLMGCNWSLGAEFLVLNFSNRTHSFTSGTLPFRFGVSDTAYVGRVLLNYRFGDLCGCF